ncbi:tRNA lysidine(34) synthetase TilS [Lacticaseibacillus mingshuiensis]|uniref:tRNA(Ile)-lysidine synthase n=1 Tax=Lacticaseibacillus mingshuiensis TaxID=2799574 RepID=A0ABW4CLF6_9LACO|nr:tRNA lysidine(34) synthetase TilS [Lacticaseibacillus mingshuiensis]
MFSIDRALMKLQVPPHATLVVAVSGGVDSMVLLTMLARARTPLKLVAAQFDHQLRPTSQHEQQVVATYAAQLGVSFVAGSWPVAAHPQHASEAAAREARYAFLTKAAAMHQAKFLVLAQHRDDQLETMLLQLGRSGNLGAVRAMKPRTERDGVALLRPLLGVAKQTLRDYAANHHVPFCEDESNEDQAVPRNALRQDVIPRLTTLFPQITAHGQHFSETLDGALTLASRQAAAMLAPLQITNGVDWRPLLSEPANVQQLLLTAQLDQWDLVVASRQQQQLLAALQHGGSHQFLIAGGQLLLVEYGQLVRDSVNKPIAVVPDLVLMPDDRWHAVPAGEIGLFSAVPADAVSWAPAPAGPVTIRTRRPGDQVALPNGHHQLLRRFFIDQKVPARKRAGCLLATQGQTVFWVQESPARQLFQRPLTDILSYVVAFRPKQAKRGQDDE